MTARLTVVLVSYNAAPYLTRCLESLFRHPPSSGLDVVVVDNASRDGSPDEVRRRFPQVRLIANADNRGYGTACNQGLRGASTDYVLALNSDTEVLPGTLEGLVAAMDARPRAGILAPEFVDGGGQVIQMSWGWDSRFWGEVPQRLLSPENLRPDGWRMGLVRRLQSTERSVPIVCGAALMIRRRALEEFGLFDEGYAMYFEESDLCYRCRKAGWRVVFFPGVKLVHHLAKSSGGMPKKLALVYRQSQRHYYRKHGTALERVLLRAYLGLKFWRLALYAAFPRLDPDPAFHDSLRRVLAGEETVTL
jgi:GT2 family glycosyltransferase